MFFFTCNNFCLILEQELNKSVYYVFRLQSVSDDKPVATLLMSFSRGCGALLDLMQLPDSPCHSDGYHSEPEPEAVRGYACTDFTDYVTIDPLYHKTRCSAR